MDTKKHKVLVGCPIFEGHRKWVKPFIEEHKDYDIMFIENTIPKYDKGLYQHLIDLKQDNPQIVEVRKHEWDPTNKWYIYMIGDCIQETIDYAIENGYTHYFWTAADIFFVEDASIQKLLEHDKDLVGYPTNMYNYAGPPSVYYDNWHIFDEETGRFKLNYYSWEEIEANPGLTPVYGCIGATLIKTEILKDKRVRFHHPTNDHTYGEDLLLLQYFNQAGYKFYCDFSGRCMNYTEADDYVKTLRNMYLVMKTHREGKEDGN